MKKFAQKLPMLCLLLLFIIPLFQLRIHGVENTSSNSEQQVKKDVSGESKGENDDPIFQSGLINHNDIEKSAPDVHTKFIDLYFLDPTKYNAPAPYCRTSACQRLLQEINNSKESIYFAIYGISHQPEVYEALLKKKADGLDIKWVTDATEDGGNIYSDTKDLMSACLLYTSRRG